MAVASDAQYQPTEELILPSPRKYYKAYMNAGHWQLRAFVSSPSPNVIHYLGGRDIYQINTASLVREIVDTLPFTPRCLTSSNGWVCCGGEDGKFSALHLNAKDNRGNLSNQADDPLPLDFDSFSRLHVGYSSQINTTQTAQHPSEVRIIGPEILNCITLWFPGPDNAEGAHSTPVAVVASNDNSTYVVNLDTLEVIQSLEEKEPVNLGRISIDGSILIVVGDDPFMHVYKRQRDKPIGKGCGEYSWHKFTSIQLPGQRLGDQDEMRGSFTGSFSERYLAVGTQYGVISIFKLEDLTASENPYPFFRFQTTRPGTREGAVRSLQFSSSRLADLLAVTEDGGRVIVADVRELGKRQEIDTEPSTDGLETVSLTERIGDEVPGDPRQQLDRNSVDEESPETFLERYQRQTALRLGLPSHQLTREETAVLEALQVERRRREREGNPNGTNVTWNDVSDELQARIRNSSDRDQRLPDNSLPSSMRELLSNRNSDSLRAFILERNQERDQRSGTPRRRGFLVAARAALDAESLRDGTGNTSTTSTEANDAPPRLSLHLPSSLSIHSSSNSWAEIEAIYRLSVETPEPRSRIQTELDDAARRNATLSGQAAAAQIIATRRLQSGGWTALRDNPQGSTIRARYLGRNTSHSMNQTTGCSWSPNGQILYVGTEGGIYEYHVNMYNRKVFPSIALR